MSDLKSLLKEAKNAIKDKDYEAAMIHCKDALKIERKNYQALVMFGRVCIEERRFMDSKKALMLASQIEPENPVAWQGLINLHEKNSSVFDQDEELSVLEHVKTIVKDEEKLFDIHFKLAASHQKYNSPLQAVSVLDQLIGISSNENKIKEIRQNIIEILENSDRSSSEISNQLIKNYELILDKSELGVNENNYEKYLKILYKLSKFDKLLKAAISMSRIFPTAIPLEWISRVSVETYNLDTKSSEVDKFLTKKEFFQIISKLLCLFPSTPYGNISYAILLLEEDKYYEAKRYFKIGCENLTSNIQLWLLYISVLKIHRDIVTLESVCKRLTNFLDSNTGIKIPSDFSTVDDLKRYLLLTKLNALYHLGRPNHLQELVSSLTNMEDLDDSLRMMLIRSQLRLGLKDQAVEELKILKINSEIEDSCDIQKITALVAMSNGDRSTAQSIYEDILQVNSEDTDALFGLGKMHFENEDYSKAIAYLLKTAKVDSRHSSTFVYLGHYYRLSNNLDKARKCYEKALAIDPSCEDGGQALSDLYRKIGQNEANFELLKRLTKQSNCDWVWLKLGLHYIAVGELTEAVNVLQKAVQANPNDRTSLECLGDAYLSRGSCTAALKVFTKVVDVHPGEALYAHCQIALINHLIGDYLLSISQYEAVLAENLPSSLETVALVGLSQVLLARAKKYSEEKLLTNLKNDCISAIKYLTRCAKENPSMLTVWKLLGDSCTMFKSVPSSSLCEVPAHLLDFSVHDVNKVSVVTKDEVIQLGARCYGVGLRISPENSSLWHDLGLNIFYQAYSLLKMSKESKNCLEDDFQLIVETFSRRSLAALKKALVLCPTDVNFWNTYGVVAVFSGDIGLAQHAFIQSLKIHPTVESWTNLGSLYLHQNDPTLAHEAFCQAQALNPRFSNCWIGQAMVATSVGHYEAFDLYCHATQLKINSEACIGFASKIFDLMHENHPDGKEVQRIEHFLPNVLDCLTFYSREYNLDIAGLIMLGICCENKKLYKSAYDVFSRALKALTDNVSVTCEIKDMIHSNLARVCLRLNKIQEAINLYSNVKEHTFYSQCNLALAKLKDCQYEESYQAYIDACEWFAVNDVQKGLVLTALSFLYYNFGKIDDVKTHLFQSVNISPSIESRLALAALGLLQEDAVLIDAALGDIVPLEDDKDYVHHVAFLKAVEKMLRGNFHEAKLVLSRAIHKHPDNANLWRSLSRILISFTDNGNQSGSFFHTKITSAANCAVSSAIVLSQAGKCQKFINQDVVMRSFTALRQAANDSCSDSSGIRRTRPINPPTELISDVGTKHKALIEAQKSVLMCPASTEAWAVLLHASKLNVKDCKMAYRMIKNSNQANMQNWLKSIPT